MTREHVPEEIDRLAEAEARIERLEKENARLWGAGALLAKGVPPFERRMHPAFDAACRVFEEER